MSLLTTMLAGLERETDFFFQHAAANETAEQLQPEVFTRLLDSGAIHAMVPSALGGSGFGALGVLRIIETLSRADASTGWVAMAMGFCTGAAAAYLDEACAAQIFASGAPGLVAGAGAPTGVATIVPGGFEVSGRWRYGSGLLHAQWVHCGVLVEKDGRKVTTANGVPAVRIAYLPVHQVQLLGNWDVIGLCATGSVDFSAYRIFVPEHFTIDAATPKRQRGDAIFAHSLFLGTLIGHCGWAMGTARRLLDELARFARTGSLRSGSLAGNHAFHEHYAQHEAAVRAAHALTYDAWGSAQRLMSGNGVLTTWDLTLIRLSLVHATNAATAAANFAYRTAGGETLRHSSLQRLCRDILAGGQHITSSSGVLQACGRVLAGMAPGEVWAVNSLVGGSPEHAN